MARAIRHCVLTCCDWRLTNELSRFVGQHGDADRLEIPGAALALTQLDSQEVVRGWLRTLRDLHHFQEIHLIDHTDCGAYRLQYPSITSKTEHEKHARCLEQAQQFIQSDPALAKVTVTGYVYNVETSELTQMRSSHNTPANQGIPA